METKNLLLIVGLLLFLLLFLMSLKNFLITKEQERKQEYLQNLELEPIYSNHGIVTYGDDIKIEDFKKIKPQFIEGEEVNNIYGYKINPKLEINNAKSEEVDL